jgi:hypothetical protein
MAEAVSIWHQDVGVPLKNYWKLWTKKALVRPIPVNSPVTDP